MVRAGLMLYGSAPRPEFQPRLRAVMTWKTRIILLRTAPAGHGTGRAYVARPASAAATAAPAAKAATIPAGHVVSATTVKGVALDVDGGVQLLDLAFRIIREDDAHGI